MSTKIWCPRDGSQLNWSDCVEVEVPDICCGVVTIPFGNSMPGAFMRSCKTHIASYLNIWNNFGPNGSMKVSQIGGTNITIGGQASTTGGVINVGVIRAAGKPISKTPEPKYGYNCELCHVYNEYAVANQPNDKFICYSCSH